MLDLLKRIGIEENSVFQRKTLDLHILDPKYPPLHLSAHPLLPWQIAILPRLYSSLGWQELRLFLRLARQLNVPSFTDNITVEQWCRQTGQSTRLITQLWIPLCLAILNTPIEQASASVFAATLRDSLTAKRKSADLLIPKKSLGDVLPGPASRFIKEHVGEIRLQSRIEKIVIEAGKVAGVITGNKEYIAADNIIVAISPSVLYKLLGVQLNLAPVSEYPISTIYLQYSPYFRLNAPIIGLSNSLPQWVFDLSLIHI